MRLVLPWLLLPSILFAAGDDFASGVRAYEEGRYRDALAAFTEAQIAAGEEAPAELLFNRALAALRAGDLREAEASAARAAERGGREFAALRDFMRGNAAFQRCAWTEAQANEPSAPPFALDSAIQYAESARAAWQAAAASRDDWPEARRNVERALRKLEELRRKKEEAEKNRPEQPKPKEPELRPNPPEPEGRTTEEETTPEPQLVELSPEEVQRLLDKLGEKEKEKIAMRQARRRARTVEVEKDW